jgi:hypothetical protein
MIQCESVSDVTAFLSTHKSLHSNAKELLLNENGPYKSFLLSRLREYTQKVKQLADFSFTMGSDPPIHTVMNALAFVDDVVTMNGFCDTLDVPAHNGRLDNIVIASPFNVKLIDYLAEKGVKVYTSREAYKNQAKMSQLANILIKQPEKRGKVRRVVFKCHKCLISLANLDSLLIHCVVYDDERGEIVPLISYVCEILPKNTVFQYFHPITAWRHQIVVSSLRRLTENGTFQERVPKLFKTSSVDNLTLIMTKNPCYTEIVCIR